MFLRSSKNAGFDVSKDPIDEAVRYINRCYRSRLGTFNYASSDVDRHTRAMAGAGLLALAHAGVKDTAKMQQVGDWILEHRFTLYNQSPVFGPTHHHRDRYHYSLFNCSQAMYQLGGRYWKEFFPPTVDTLMANQRQNGSWPPENHRFDGNFGSTYTTALVVLSLGAPNQLLPVFQR